jgi:hypothetical protein
VLGINALLRDEPISSIDDLAFSIDSKAFRERYSAPASRFAGIEID